jgi:sodium transport system permease protein
MKDALIIWKKELKNVFKDKGAIFSNYVLPLFLMPAIFFIMAFVEDFQRESARDTIYGITIVNNDDPALRQILGEYLKFSTDPREDCNHHLVLFFPEGYLPGETATVEVTFDSTNSKSTFATDMIDAALVVYENRISETTLKRVGLSLGDLDTIHLKRVDTAPEEAQGAGFIGLLLPYIILIYLFAGSMSIGIDTTAGERERGSLASLLVNQVSRGSIAMGKVMFVVSSSLISGVASFLGLLIGFHFIGGFGGDAAGAGLQIFTFTKMLPFLIGILSMCGVAASSIVLLGSMAKSAKEGAGYVMPVYMLAILIGIATMQMDPSSSLSLYLIPVVNGVFLLKGIIFSQASLLHLLITVVVNLLTLLVLVYFTARLYSSERILSTV